MSGPLARSRNPAGQTLAALVSAISQSSGVLLLAVAGWFLTGAALAATAGAAAALAFNYLLPSALIRVLALSRTLARYGERYLAHRVALMAMADLRADLFHSLAERDPRHQLVPSEAETAARLAGDVDQLEARLVRAPALWGALAGGAVALVTCLWAGWTAALALGALLFALPPLLTAMANRWAAAPAEASVTALGAWRARLVELAAARAEIAAYGLADRALAALEPTIDDYEAARASLHRTQVAQAALVQLAGGLAVLLVLALGRGSAPGIALAGLAAAGGVEALGVIAQAAFQQTVARTSLARLADLESGPGAPTDAGMGTHPSDGLLHLAGIAVTPGERIVLAGPSGSGKTTVLEALAGLRAAVLDATLDGRRLDAAVPEAVSAQFALSPQAAPVLIGTLADNLRLASPGVDEAAMWQALETACLADRVRALPHGLDEPIGAGGIALSGGERKRLSLARALLAERPFLLLDEPTEGLDAQTEARLVERLDDWLRQSGNGLILASHRQAPLTLATRQIAADALLRPGSAG